MTPDEKQAAKQTGKIISSVRKSGGLTQSAIARQLGVSQSALSKIENGILIPSVHQWFEFCKFTSIPVESHLMGYVDLCRPVSRTNDIYEGAYKLPKKYSIERGSSIRTMLPLIRWLYETEGESKAEAILNEMGMDPDYFIQLDHTISIQFGLDLISLFQKQGTYNAQQLNSLFKPIQRRSSHGCMWSGYEKIDQAIEIIGLLRNGTDFTCI